MTTHNISYTIDFNNKDEQYAKHILSDDDLVSVARVIDKRMTEYLSLDGMWYKYTQLVTHVLPLNKSELQNIKIDVISMHNARMSIINTFSALPLEFSYVDLLNLAYAVKHDKMTKYLVDKIIFDIIKNF